MERNREFIDPGGIFITHRTRTAILEAAERRTKAEIEESYTRLYESMDQFGKRIAVEQITGQDFIIYTPERRIGKTEAALYLANEYNMPYLVKSCNYQFVQQQAKDAGYNIKFIILCDIDRMNGVMNGMRARTILKDECIKTKEARQRIREDINIIGIEGI